MRKLVAALAVAALATLALVPALLRGPAPSAAKASSQILPAVSAAVIVVAGLGMVVRAVGKVWV